MRVKIAAAFVAATFLAASSSFASSIVLVDPAGAGGFDISSPADGASTSDFTFGGPNAVGRATGGGFTALGRSDNSAPISGANSIVLNAGSSGTYTSNELLTGGQVIESGDILEFSIDVAATGGLGGSVNPDIAAFLILDQGLASETVHLLTDDFDPSLTGVNVGRFTIATPAFVGTPGVDPINPVNYTDLSTIGGSGDVFTSAVLEFTVGTGTGQAAFDNLSLALVIPEPSAIALGLLGLAGVAVRRRR